MARYEEIVNAFWESHEGYFNKSNEVSTFAADVLNKFLNYLEAPPEAVKVRPMSGEYDSNEEYTTFGALTMEEDARWHIGVLLTLIKPNVITPRPTSLIHLIFREKPYGSGIYEVRLDEGKDTFLLDGTEESHTRFFDYLYDVIYRFYHKRLERFLGKDRIEKIGF